MNSKMSRHTKSIDHKKASFKTKVCFSKLKALLTILGCQFNKTKNPYNLVKYVLKTIDARRKSNERARRSSSFLAVSDFRTLSCTDYIQLEDFPLPCEQGPFNLPISQEEEGTRLI